MAARENFFLAWLVVLSLMITLVLGGALMVLWRTGVLSGENSITDMFPGEEASGPEDESGIADGPPVGDGLPLRLAYLNPVSELLVMVESEVPDAQHPLGRIMNALDALHQAPGVTGLLPAVPPELQFRAVYYDRETQTVFVDLSSWPEAWSRSGWLEVSACLYAITNTITDLWTGYQTVRFLVAGGEPDRAPGGVSLEGAFRNSQEWVEQR